MTHKQFTLDRRSVLKTALAAGAAQLASPFVITARAGMPM